MRKILRLARREYLESVKTKGFILMLVLMPLWMGGSGIAMCKGKWTRPTSRSPCSIIPGGMTRSFCGASAGTEPGGAVFRS